MADISTIVGAGLIAEATSAAPGVCTLTIPVSAVPNTTIWLDGYIISASAAPAAAVVWTITGAATTIHQNIPANAFAPIGYSFGTRPLPAQLNQALVLSCPSLGGTAISTITAFYHYGPLV